MSPTAPVTTITPTLRRRRGLTEQAAVAAVDQACRRLRLPTVRAVLDEALSVAGKEQLSYQGFLAELLLAECDDRDRRSSIRRVKAANFPRDKWLGDFDFDANTKINPATIHTLATGDWILKGAPLCLIGDSGTGKSHLLICLGTAAAEKGYRVKYTLATRLVNELVEAADEKMLAKTIAHYGRVDLLCIDELGYMELDRRGAELLFQVLTEREEMNSIAIASNESSSGWTKTFTDPRLCAAIVDRLTFNGTTPCLPPTSASASWNTKRKSCAVPWPICPGTSIQKNDVPAGPRAGCQGCPDQGSRGSVLPGTEFLQTGLLPVPLMEDQEAL